METMAPNPPADPVVRVARALGDPTRYRLLRAIASRRELSCQELTGLLALAQGTVSHHLRILSGAGLVVARVEGPFHYYRALPEALTTHGRALAATFGALPVSRRSVSPRSPAARRRLAARR
jgi:ArsR family transcriptional regulator